MNTYMSGSLVREIAMFVNSAGVLTNPTTTTMKYRLGAGVTNTVSNPINDSQGVFHWDIDTTGWAGPGNQLVTCEWTGTGAIQAIGPDYFGVEPPAL